MASKNCPETPRQRMIGMMYLVLTAMLALNVSRNVLDAFTTIDSGLRKTIASNEKQNDGMYADFQVQNEKNPGKVGPFLEMAKQVKVKSDEIANYIDKYKYEMVKIADGEETDKNALNIESKDNIDAPKEYANKDGNSKKLKSIIDQYKEFVVKMTDGDPGRQDMFRKLFDTGNNQTKWSDNLFESQPLAAAVTYLTKIQADVRMAESETIQYLRARADLQDYTLNKLEAFIVPESSYVLQGETYKAKIILAATDTTKGANFKYYVNGSQISGNEYAVTASGIGPHTFSASIAVPDNNGNVKNIPSKPVQYMVGKPAATLSNIDLNVVFKGIENKFRISVPGVAESELRVSAEGASVGKVGDYYIVKPTAEKQIKINVAANINGKVSNMGSETYRVKYLPNPSAYIQYTDASGITRLTKDAKMSKKLLRGGIQLIASYGEDALIEAKFDITSFNMVTLLGASLSNSSTLSAKQRADIEELEGGDNITFKNIKAVGPDGKTRDIGAVTVSL